MLRIDPVTLEIIWTRIGSMVDEAAKVIARTAFSTLSSEANDFACVLTDARGNSLAENTGSIPSFIATLPATVRHMIDGIGTQRMRPGDVLVTNNPWQGTGHLNDVCLVRPIFRDGILIAFAASTSHVPDIGGRIRSIEPKELFEEGFHIPLMHLLRAGEPDETLLRLLRTNVRTPDQTVGDIFAQVGALDLLERRLLEMMADYALPSLEAVADALFGRAEAAMRKAIRALPEGTYRYAMTTDGLDAPFEIKVAVRVAGSEIAVDYAGTSPQQPRAVNTVWAYTYAMTAYALKCMLLPNLPNNAGMFRSIAVTAPEGSIVNPRFPAACGGRASVGHYLPVAIFGALAEAVPDRVIAGAGSPLWILTQTGVRKEGTTYATVLFFNGGMGALAGKDGANCLSWPSNISSTPVEIAERNGPLFFHHKRLRPDSGGAGTRRGGLGQEILIESLSETPIAVGFIAERTRFPAPGLRGGAPGGLGAVLVNGAIVDNRVQHTLDKGDTILLATPGGGGYGAPEGRPRPQAERDRALGYVAGTMSD
ncbi:MAG: hydantoinase B/oxoprolinase family protein [Alphaproteobacteria bacterium]|nr:hydantoinase B/oxoprolinase family protein [Alphaproteobacteria bacterium]